MSFQAPCKGCTERYLACWGSCEKYLTAKAEYETRKATNRLDAEAGAYTAKRVYDNRDHSTKRRRESRGARRSTF